MLSGAKASRPYITDSNTGLTKLSFPRAFHPGGSMINAFGFIANYGVLPAVPAGCAGPLAPGAGAALLAAGAVAAGVAGFSAGASLLVVGAGAPAAAGEAPAAGDVPAGAAPAGAAAAGGGAAGAGGGIGTGLTEAVR